MLKLEDIGYNSSLCYFRNLIRDMTVTAGCHILGIFSACKESDHTFSTVECSSDQTHATTSVPNKNVPSELGACQLAIRC